MGLLFKTAEERNALGLKALGLGEYDTALGHFRRAIDKEPGEDVYWWNYALACVCRGLLPQAESALQECIRLKGPMVRKARSYLRRVEKAQDSAEEAGMLTELAAAVIASMVRGILS